MVAHVTFELHLVHTGHCDMLQVEQTMSFPRPSSTTLRKLLQL